jgi:Tn7-like transposition protein D/TniQ
VISLPKPYEDELLCSVLARAVAYLAPTANFTVKRLLFGQEAHSALFGTRLDELAKFTKPVWGLSWQEILERHTLVPFYGRFLPRDQLSRCLEVVRFGGGPISARLGLQHQNNVISPLYLRFCRSCALDDIATYGETFWRRSHQLSGAIICTTHAEVLSLSRAAIVSKRKTAQDATDFIDFDSAQHCAALTSRERLIAERVSIRCRAFLHATPTQWKGVDLPSQYNRSAIALGYLQSTRNPKRLSQQELKHKFSEFYGGALLKKMGCNCNFEPHSTWIAKIFRQSSSSPSHPLFHALVQVFLEAKCASQGSSEDKLRYEPQEWKCPNQYALHDALFRIPAVHRRWGIGGRYFSARCSCGYGFSFRHASTKDPLLPEITRVFAWGPYFEQEAKRLQDEQPSIRAIASRMNVCHSVAARLLRRKKNLFEYTEKEIHSWRSKWLKSRSNLLYWRLFRNDRGWLSAQERKINRGGKGRPKNWSELDKTYAPLLLSAVESLKTRFPNRRISYLVLEEESGIKSLKIKARRLPICSAILSKTIEPRR